MKNTSYIQKHTKIYVGINTNNTIRAGRRVNGYVWAVDAEAALEQGAVLLSVFAAKTLCPLCVPPSPDQIFIVPCRSASMSPCTLNALPCWRALQLLLLPLLLKLPLPLLVLNTHMYTQ